MGLGKTLSCIALIMANPPPSTLDVIYGPKDEVTFSQISIDINISLNFY
jgi:hypothetical protein